MLDLTELMLVDLGDQTDPDTPAGERATIEAVRLFPRAPVLALGGDNSITFAVAHGACADGLITLDAHHDLRDGRSNGSPVRRLVESGLDGRRVVQIGISDFANSAFYAARARELGITVISREELERRPMADAMAEALEIAGSGPTARIHVDLDVDVCDRAVAPACPASVPGGISARELRTAARAAGTDPRVVSLDITEVDASGRRPRRPHRPAGRPVRAGDRHRGAAPAAELTRVTPSRRPRRGRRSRRPCGGRPWRGCGSVPVESSTSTVGVRVTSSWRTRSRCDSASTSMCTTPGTIAATSPSTTRVARHGVQKAEENCRRVACSPRGWPRSAGPRTSAAGITVWSTTSMGCPSTISGSESSAAARPPPRRYGHATLPTGAGTAGTVATVRIRPSVRCRQSPNRVAATSTTRST